MAILVHPVHSPNEVSFEVFSFQMQLSTDINLLGNFTGVLFTHIQMFTSHKSIKKGKTFYDAIVSEHKRKDDEKRRIT